MTEIAVAPLKRSEVVMVNDGKGFSGIWFRQPEDPKQIFLMDPQHWEDMGSPETITVTIEPGNTIKED